MTCASWPCSNSAALLSSRDNKRPTLADLRDSGAIEQDADIVMFPFREGYYVARELDALRPEDAQAMELGEQLRKVGSDLELIVAKNRQGAAGRFGYSAT